VTVRVLPETRRVSSQLFFFFSFAEIGIESLIVDAKSGQVMEEVFELGNGCVCCSVRGELQRVLENILARDETFDHIIVETTGLANPGTGGERVLDRF
jgi:G3E family GTPase